MRKIADFCFFLHVACLFLLICTLPFRFSWVQLPVLWAVGISYVLDYFADKRYRRFAWMRDKWLYAAFILFFLLAPIWHLFEGATDMPVQFSRNLDNRMPFAVIGVIGILGINGRLRLRWICQAVLAVCLGVILYVVFARIGFRDFVTGDAAWLFQENRIAFVSAHMRFNMFLNIGLVCGWYLLQTKGTRLVPKIVVGISSAVIYSTLFISEGRTGFVTANLVVACCLLQLSYRSFRRYFAWACAACAVAFVLVLACHPRFGRMTRDPRMEIWLVALQMAKERPLLGYGVCNAREQFIARGMHDGDFVERYAALYEARTGNDLSSMHPHNAFLEVMLEYGIVGLSVFAFCLIAPLWLTPRRHRFYFFLLVLIFSLQACFESLGPHLPVLFFCLFVLLFNQAQGEPLCSDDVVTGGTAP